MSFHSTWSDATSAYAEGEYAEALHLFQNVHEPKNKFLLFNMGVVELKLQHYDASINYFTRALAIDPMLAVARFMLGEAYFRQAYYSYAEEGFSRILMDMKDKEYVPYADYGMNWNLYRCEVHFNRAVCHWRMNLYESAYFQLELARKFVVTAVHRAVIIRAGKRGLEGTALFNIPQEMLFSPGDYDQVSFEMALNRSPSILDRFQLNGVSLPKRLSDEASVSPGDSASTPSPPQNPAQVPAATRTLSEKLAGMSLQNTPIVPRPRSPEMGISPRPQQFQTPKFKYGSFFDALEQSLDSPVTDDSESTEQRNSFEASPKVTDDMPSPLPSAPQSPIVNVWPSPDKPSKFSTILRSIKRTRSAKELPDYVDCHRAILVGTLQVRYSHSGGWSSRYCALIDNTLYILKSKSDPFVLSAMPVNSSLELTPGTNRPNSWKARLGDEWWQFSAMDQIAFMNWIGTLIKEISGQKSVPTRTLVPIRNPEPNQGRGPIVLRNA
ncbi:uncharacterized protein BJ171DRAFT_127526 [Polychytrium aggregatum]|uniref:uncharacterized protein n=1 Tax=Polychytrium aggregatum TaxID=110093 RepID=UPI0022FE013A|nr:uncharacterized protein BJ171DRAFT_127526 [Polychytrium aggregatum]KAI9204027.1 hypothetical protein BJ171DRAFT_127526 [Polychytrium aggregatum]